ncbi:L,D-transpeptidase family protein [Acidiferrimicrobium sp. IK]|uniref:L,D-transpeptidase n=1 Tax=Acidiferrimicrobium sp. IK TaxID=2871700 RepID=UPI0021CB34D4|nr:Ig-like domain-containing protein [Acidiferrimicrobium sp. IK]MCU4186513.1 L,D-transpeptidase family protein [Acidiferrimicrobium sp. IK]
MAQHKQHAARRGASPWLVGGVAALAVIVVGALVLVITNSGGSPPPSASAPKTTTTDAAQRQASEEQARAQLAAKLASAVTVSPAAGATAVVPSSPVTVTTTEGQLSNVIVSSAAGAAVAGTMAAGSQQWTSSAPLAVATTYTVTGEVAGTDGITAPFHSSFTTLTPTETVTNTLFPLDGDVVGVGQPVVVRFNHPISTAAEQASVLLHLTVAESQPVPGGWHWFSEYELHFRPEAYWPTGEKISVTSDLNGWDAGAGRWGAGHVNVKFSIGDAHISVAHLDTHVMTVSDNGNVVATYPISAGSTVYPTMNGIHIAMDKESVVHMVSSTVGIPVNSPAGYDEMVYSDVHISDSGEYVHAAPWSVNAQGNTNVSHGCINLAPANAAAFMAFSQIGDIIQVVGGPRPPVYGDHGVMDWDTAWSQFTPATVAQL